MKHLRGTPRPICPSVLKTLVDLTCDPRTPSRLHPLASPSFLHRVTTRPRQIVRRKDGQFMLAALLGSAAEEGLPTDGAST